MSSQEIRQITKEAPEIEARKLGLMDSAKELADIQLDLPDYEIAGLTELQKEALRRGDTMFDPTADFDLARDYLAATVGADPAAIQAAMDPYIGEVIERSQQDIFDQARQQSKQFEDAAMGQGAYGGARGALLPGVLAAEAARDAGDLGARLRSQGYNDALNRLGQAATGIASLGQVQQGADQSGIGFQFDLGAREQAQKQAELDTLRQTQTQQMLEPYQRIGFLSDIYQGAPSSAMTFTEGTAPNEPSPMQELFGYGIAGLSAASGAQQLGLFG